VAAFHSFGWYAAEEIFSPESWIFTTSCNCHPEEMVTAAGGADCAAANGAAQMLRELIGTDIRASNKDVRIRKGTASLIGILDVPIERVWWTQQL